MPQNLWILPLKSPDGRTRGNARITQNGTLISVELRSKIPSNAQTYLLCPDGPVRLTNGAAQTNGTVLGIVVMHDGKFLLEGLRRGAKINLEREKMHLRMSNTPRTAAEPARGPETPDQIPSEADVSISTEEPPSAAAQTAITACTETPEQEPETVSKAAKTAVSNVPPPTDPAGKSEALQNILIQARALFPQPSTAVYPSRLRQTDDISPVYVEKPVSPAPPAPPAPAFNPKIPPSAPISNPFPNAFPHASWRRVFRGQGQGWYLEGEWMRGNEHIHITAVPADYRPTPPKHLSGFSRYIKTPDGGYWLRLRRSTTR